MPDDLRPDEIQGLWRDEPRNPSPVSIEAVRRRALEAQAHTHRALMVAGIAMLSSAACYAGFLYLFPGTLQRLGASLTLAAYLYCTWQFRPNGPSRGLLASAPAATCAAYQAELRRRRDFPWISRLMLPFIPGPALFVLGFLIPEFGVSSALGLTAALMLPPFVLAVPLLRRKRRSLQREIDELGRLLT